MKNLDLDKPRCKYHSYDTIPAKVFFEIRDTGNLQLMKPKPGVETEFLSKLFSQIYDDYFVKINNKSAEKYIKLVNLTAFIKFKISVIKSILQMHWEIPKNIWNHPTVVNMRNEQIAALNRHLDHPFDLSADFNTEMQTALNVSLGILENEFNEYNIDLESYRKQASKTVFEFYDSLQMINEANNQGLGSDILLPEYVAAEKSAIRKSEQIRNKKIRDGIK